MAEQPYNYYIWLLYFLMAIFGIGFGGLLYTIFNSFLFNKNKTKKSEHIIYQEAITQLQNCIDKINTEIRDLKKDIEIVKSAQVQMIYEKQDSGDQTDYTQIMC